MMKKMMKYITWILKRIVIMIVSMFVKRNENYIAIGSWQGEKVIDNSKYLMEYLDKEYSHYKLFWVGKKTIKEEVLRSFNNVIFLEKDTFISNIKLLKCKYFFFSQFHTADISSYSIYKNAVLCYLGHGMPIKKSAADGLNQNVEIKGIKSRFISWIMGSTTNYNYFVTSSKLHDMTNFTALAFKGCTAEKNIHSGTPRNDFFVNYNKELAEHKKEEYSKTIGVDINSKIIMYLPTYRRISENIFSFSKLSDDELNILNNILEKHNAILIEKSHSVEKIVFNGVDSERIKFANRDANVQEMMLFTDILISDYSGAFTDFIILDRPVIHFAYDYDYYKNVDSGLYYEIEEFSAGAVSYDYNSLMENLEDLLSGKDEHAEKRRSVRNKFMSYETGEASKKIIERVLNIKDK